MSKTTLTLTQIQEIYTAALAGALRACPLPEGSDLLALSAAGDPVDHDPWGSGEPQAVVTRAELEADAALAMANALLRSARLEAREDGYGGFSREEMLEWSSALAHDSATRRRSAAIRGLREAAE